MDEIKAIWGDTHIRKMLEDGLITNSDERFINPASINLRLGDSFIRPLKDRCVELGSKMEYEAVPTLDDGTVFIRPGEFMLATTMEYIEVPTISAAFVQGRSSIGRIGLTIQNAGFVDPGFRGHITLELKNDSPCYIILKPGYPVAQLVFISADGVSRGYSGKYNDQVEATGSRMYMDEKFND